MNESERYQDLLGIIQPYLPEDVNVDAISPESNLLNDLNINSSHLVDIVLDVEDRFDILLEDSEIDQMTTVAEALQIIESKLRAS